MNVIIVGSGAVASELTSYIADNNRHFPGNQLYIKGYLDNEENIDKYWAKYKLKQPVLGNVLSYQIQPGEHFIIGIANINYRKKVIAALQDRGGVITGFRHHSSIVAETAELGIGNIIYPFCIIGPNAKLGNHNLITSYSFISHDCTIGDNNFLSTAGLSGMVTVLDDNFFGIRSTVIPEIKIGSRNTVQAGMVVDKDIASDTTVFHRFKEKIIAVPKN